MSGEVDSFEKSPSAPARKAHSPGSDIPVVWTPRHDSWGQGKGLDICSLQAARTMWKGGQRGAQEETEAQSSHMTCPGALQGKWQSWDWNPGLLGPRYLLSLQPTLPYHASREGCCSQMRVKQLSLPM